MPLLCDRDATFARDGCKRASGRVKFATFNINDIRRRLPNLLAWLDDSRPDIACLQELKTPDAGFPADAVARAGYGAVWSGEGRWNGVAILARDAEPVLTRTALPGDVSDGQARYIEAAVRGVLVASLYAPNGNPQPGPKLDYKLTWLRRLRAHAESLLRADAPVVLAGDFNVVPTDADIYSARSWKKDALLHPVARAIFAGMAEDGWSDALRSLYPDDAPYTFWSYFRERWPRDAGLRIDHLLLNAQAAKSLRAGGVDRTVRGQDNASDHAPAWVDLKLGRNTRQPRNTRQKHAQSTVPKERHARRGSLSSAAENGLRQGQDIR